MRLMKTSSSPGNRRFAGRAPEAQIGCEGTRQSRGIRAADMQRGFRRPRPAVDARPGSDAGWRTAGRGRTISQVDEPGVLDDLGHRAAGEQVAIGDVGEPMAALRLVHVVGGDQDRQTLGGQAVKFLPEFPSGLGVDSRRWVRRAGARRGRMDETGGEGQPLFPTPGEDSGELLAAIAEAEAFEAGRTAGRRSGTS
jgi:hypothetical protein